MFFLSRAWGLWIIVLVFSAGCGWNHSGLLHGSSQPAPVALENPLFVPVADPDVLWDQIVDTVDDYFKIQREQRVHVVGDVPLEGRIETFPEDGSTILEPWRKDSTPGYEKMLATLQSIRRQATIRVQPAQGGYLVEVVVQKYLEDLERPERSTTSTILLQDYQSPEQGDPPQEGDVPLMSGWMPFGRDASLEQRILGEIRNRFTGG